MLGRRRSKSKGSVPAQTGASPPAAAPPPPPAGTAPAPAAPPQPPETTQVRPPGATPSAPTTPSAAPPPGGAIRAGRPPLPPPPGAPTTSTQPAAGSRPGLPPAPPPEEPTSLDALRAWVAQIDRKLGLRTYVVLAASLLALACSVVAVVLSIDARDNSASPDEVAALEQRIATLEAASTGATSPVDPSLEAPEIAPGDAIAPSDEAAIELDDLQDQVDDLLAADQATEQRITAIEQDIEDLRSELRKAGR